MIFLYVGILILLVIIVAVIQSLPSRKSTKLEYHYKKKEYVMTQHEQECFDVLVRAVGNNYYIFPQIHLPVFLEHKTVGQNWHGAFRHIDEESVDFVLCDKQNISPKLAIELDDGSHERLDRQERDREVERILREANMPLLRIKHQDILNSQDLFKKIEVACKSGSEI